MNSGLILRGRKLSHDRLFVHRDIGTFYAGDSSGDTFFRMEVGVNDYEGTKAKIKIMQAFVDGKDIEILMHDPGNEIFWLKERMPSWNWDVCTYRISPDHETKADQRKLRIPIMDTRGNWIKP
jgi:hypothetical protein